MRSSSEAGSDVSLIVVGVWLVVVGAWISLGGSSTAALLAVGAVATVASIAAFRFVVRRFDRSDTTRV
jgi:hypothetical protein